MIERETLQQEQTATSSGLCLDVGETDDGRRWACTLHAGHDRYWFDHLALTDDRTWPVVMWRKHDGHLAAYLAKVERSQG